MVTVIELQLCQDFGLYSPRSNTTITREDNHVYTDPNRLWERYKDFAQKAETNCNYSQAEAMWLAALSEAHSFSRLDRRLAYTLENLASFYCSVGKYEQAELFCRRALDIYRELYGPSHYSIVISLNNLAGILYNLGHYAEAEPFCLKVLEIYQYYCPHNHVDVGMAFNNLGMLYHAQKRYKMAERFYRRALAIRKESMGSDDVFVRQLLLNYSSLVKELKEAEQRATIAKFSPLRIAV